MKNYKAGLIYYSKIVVKNKVDDNIILEMYRPSCQSKIINTETKMIVEQI